MIVGLARSRTSPITYCVVFPEVAVYKSILVPLDGSRRAEAILPHVESLALSYKSYVLMLRVIEPGQVIVDPHESMLQLQLEEFKNKEQEVRAYLRGHIGEFRERGIKTDLRIAQGPVVKSIIQMASWFAVFLPPHQLPQRTCSYPRRTPDICQVALLRYECIRKPGISIFSQTPPVSPKYQPRYRPRCRATLASARWGRSCLPSSEIRPGRRSRLQRLESVEVWWAS